LKAAMAGARLVMRGRGFVSLMGGAAPGSTVRMSFPTLRDREAIGNPVQAFLVGSGFPIGPAARRE